MAVKISVKIIAVNKGCAREGVQGIRHCRGTSHSSNIIARSDLLAENSIISRLPHDLFLTNKILLQ